MEEQVVLFHRIVATYLTSHCFSSHSISATLKSRSQSGCRRVRAASMPIGTYSLIYPMPTSSFGRCYLYTPIKARRPEGTPGRGQPR
jgi:hypothetical protein